MFWKFMGLCLLEQEGEFLAVSILECSECGHRKSLATNDSELTEGDNCSECDNKSGK